MECRRHSENLSVALVIVRAISLKVLAIVAGLTSTCPALLGQKYLLQAKGHYFAYSYDLNQVYGEEVEFEILDYQVTGRYLKIDLAHQAFCVFGEVVLSNEQEILQGDEFWFSPGDRRGVVLTYKETLSSKDIGGKEGISTLSLIKDTEEISLIKIEKSLIYFTAKSIDVTTDFEVIGHHVTLFLEGIKSVSFKKINMSSGLSREIAGIALEKIWFNKTQGLITRLSHSYEKRDKFNTRSQITYEEHSILKNYEGLKRQFDLMTSWSVSLPKNVTLAFNGNYNSSNLWNTNAFLNKKWSNKTSTQIDFSFNKPVLFKGEAWLGLQSSFQTNRGGNLVLSGKIGSENQALGHVAYSTSLFKRVNIYLASSYSRLRLVGTSASTKIWTNNLNVSFTSRIFNLSTDYFLNRDLVGQQSLSQPQLSLGTNPLPLYRGLLSFRIQNIFILNESMTSESKQRTYSNNLTFNLMTEPLFLSKQLSLNVDFSLEQFSEKSGRNFTSGGIIINVRQRFSDAVVLEGFYSAQSRRRSQGWFVEGTTSQDMSAIFRIDATSGFSTWFSLSYDPKYGELRTSFADVSFRIVRAWEFHALATYDFRFKKINNVDLYLIRMAGRFQLRFVWRSLSKQFLIELVPR